MIARWLLLFHVHSFAFVVRLQGSDSALVFADIVDIKPDDMEELSEVLTRAEFHPTHDSQLVYSSSKGVVRLCDLRQSARCVSRDSCS